MDNISKLLSSLIAIQSTRIENEKDFDCVKYYCNQNKIKTEVFWDKNSIYNLYGEYIGDEERQNEIDLMFLGHFMLSSASGPDFWIRCHPPVC